LISSSVRGLATSWVLVGADGGCWTGIQVALLFAVCFNYN
jgi:hypothetical protein